MTKKIMFLLLFSALFACKAAIQSGDAIDYNTAAIIKEANIYLTKRPITVTAFTCERSAGSIHDFYSEGDYWWPNPADLEGPYIRKDGQTNPNNFVAHRQAMRNLSRWVAALTAAYKVTGETKYADKALEHLKAWFIHPSTKMSAHLLYAQAIKGRVTGRGIGIIDTIHLIEVAKSISVLQSLNYLNAADLNGLKNWFNEYATWLNTHEYGLKEKDHGNNHSTWWAAQVAVFAELTNRADLMEVSRQQFKKLLSAQMDEQGGFPDELKRTKPYNYTLFNLEGYAVIAQIASTAEDNLWTFTTEKGNLATAFNFMFPFIKNKSTWAYPPDIQHFNELPIQSASLLFAGKNYNNSAYLSTWGNLSTQRQSKEIDRNFPLRQLILWED